MQICGRVGVQFGLIIGVQIKTNSPKEAREADVLPMSILKNHFTNRLKKNNLNKKSFSPTKIYCLVMTFFNARLQDCCFNAQIFHEIVLQTVSEKPQKELT